MTKLERLNKRSQKIYLRIRKLKSQVDDLYSKKNKIDSEIEQIENIGTMKEIFERVVKDNKEYSFFNNMITEQGGICYIREIDTTTNEKRYHTGVFGGWIPFSEQDWTLRVIKEIEDVYKKNTKEVKQ